MNNFSYIFNAHPNVIDSYYHQYQMDPEALDQGWRLFFQGFDFADKNGSAAAIDLEQIKKEFGVIKLIIAFRQRGHLLSTTNPLRPRKDRKPTLELANYGLDDNDLNRQFLAAGELGFSGTLQEILDKLRNIYCKNIGFEYGYIENFEKREWLRNKIESRSTAPDYGLGLEQKKRILEKLIDATVFEKFLHTKYVGQKRFSLEGGESIIPAIDAVINKGAAMGVVEVIIGMAHRGRLNILANTLGKTYEQIFSEFEGTAVPDLSFGDGDVKYHLGFSSMIETPDKLPIHLKLAPNPSHLEAVNPVVEGLARAKADLLYNSDYDKILPILIHGDAATAGQGIVYETTQMSQLQGYYTGGTIHLVINNQIGFTTDFDDARSATYCTSVASLIQAPVFHVNGDDVEAVVFAVELATEYRQKFNNDVFIDMVCYRRHGHNEGDDPKFTQPEMYELINVHPDPREIYTRKLQERGDLDKNLGEQMEKAFWDKLQQRLDLVKQKPLPYQYQETELAWRSLEKTLQVKDGIQSPKTGIKKESATKILKHLMEVPKDFKALSKINRLLQSSQKMLDDDIIDWQMGELMAYASILLDGNNVRISGQDVKRGTFSHRHAVLFDITDNHQYNRLDGFAEDQGKFMIYNSLLSEFAVLGFEYGYSLASPNNLVIWEAQFGDFYNGAQVMIDQFITAGESKWQRMSGLVLLLPHGFEGQGPEHSSARLERFLQNCADYNLQVLNITTPANFFHAMRRQLSWTFRKPLVNMAPKSILRHPLCVSKLEDFTGDTSFQPIILDTNVNKKVDRILFCSGKVYYDLLTKKKELNQLNIAIVRIEQLYPLVEEQLTAVLDHYKCKNIYWVQEEPLNMGAWQYIFFNFGHLGFKYIGRKAASSPATGFKKVHDQQQAELVAASFA